jgi:hypothetical protein
MSSKLSVQDSRELCSLRLLWICKAYSMSTMSLKRFSSHRLKFLKKPCWGLAFGYFLSPRSEQLCETNLSTLFKLMFQFNAWCLLRVCEIICSSSGRPFVYAVLYGMFFIYLRNQSSQVEGYIEHILLPARLREKRTIKLHVQMVFLLMNTQGGAGKSLARPGRKQATATKFGMCSTYSPRSSIHFLARCSDSNFFFFENRSVYEIMWKNIVERAVHSWQYRACVLHSDYLRLQTRTQNM